MASASIVYTRITSGHLVLSSEFASQTLASGAASAASDGTKSYVVVTAIGGGMDVAFTTDGSVPNPANDPKFPLMQGVPQTFTIKKGTRIGVVDRA